MSNLVLELRPGEMMIVNGAPIRFRTKARLELTAKARFLFGKQIMEPGEADSLPRQLYLALQTAYIGAEAERAGAVLAARSLASEFRAGGADPGLCALLDEAVAAALADECYAALKLARRVVRAGEGDAGGQCPGGG